MKKCSKCQENLELSNFSKDRQKRGGFRPTCKRCSEAKHKEWRLKNKQEISAYHRDFYQSNKDSAKAYALKNKSKISANMKVWRKENWPKILRYKKRYEQRRLKENPNYKLIKTLRCRILAALKKGVKYSSTVNLLGCNIPAFKIYLESKFQSGMSWDNHGRKGWHIDHIIPCSRFDLTKQTEQSKCFHYTNMQPLWSKDNLKKGSKTDYS